MTDEHGNPEEGTDTDDVQGAYFAPGSPAEHRRGLLYQGDYQNESDGTGTAVRLHVRALATTGLPILLKPFSGLVLKNGVYEPLHLAGMSDTVRAEVGDLTNASISSVYPAIRHFVCHKSEDIARRVMRGAMGSLDDPELLMAARKTVYGATVMYSVWERDRVDDATVRELNRMGDNWVPCEQNAKMLRSCGVKNVAVMPHPFDPASPMLSLTRRKPMESKRFYFIGRWEPRKNPVEILWAFFETFKPGDDVHLTMKYHGEWDGYATFAQTIREIEDSTAWSFAAIEEHLTTIEGHITADKIVKLHFENNIYLAPSCGEAWCLPAFDAKLAGNTVIHTPYGGTEDFCSPYDDHWLEYNMEDVPASYGWPVGSQWARPSQGHLKKVMFNSKAPQQYFRSANFDAKFNLETVGKKMRERLAERFGDNAAGEYLK